MTALVQTLARALVAVNDAEPLQQLLMFGAAGLIVSLLIMTYGLDLSPGFF